MGKYIGFRLGEGEYALPILEVREIINLPRLTRLPQAPPCVEGVTNLRGSVIPVLDAGKLMEVDGTGERTRVVVVGAADRAFGILVDGITGVVDVDESSVEPPERFRNGRGEFIAGVAKLDTRLIVLLDPARLVPGGRLAAEA